MDRSRHGKGFTLVELLAAMAIFALLAVMAFGGLRQLLDVQEHATAEAEALAQLQRVYQLLAQDMEQAVDRGIRDEYGNPAAAMQADSQQGVGLGLTRRGWRNPAGAARSSLQRVVYALAGGTLTRYSWWVLDRAQDSAAREQVLLEQVQALQVRFLDLRGEWHDSWPAFDPAQGNTAEGLPRALEFVLETERWGRLRWLFRLPG